MRMPRHNDGQQEKPAPGQEPSKRSPNGSTGRKSVLDEVDRLCIGSRKGLWGLFIFLAASTAAFYCRDYGLTSTIAPNLREQLGPAPPIILVNILMGVSIFSSLVLIGGRIYQRLEPGNTWTHLFFRLLFYPVYFAIDSLSAYYHAVFISGLVVLALQHYNVWSYTAKAIDIKMTAGDNLSLWQKRVSGK